MWKMLSAVGLASDGSQPETNVAWPLKKVTDMKAQAEALDEAHFAQSMEQVNCKKWEIQKWFKDPHTDGDMKFWSKPAIGRYQFAKITMTLKNTTVQAVLDLCQSDELAVRNKFSADMCQLDLIDQTESTKLFHLCYSAPKGVANREFITLCGRRTLEDGAVISYGCSVDHPAFPEKSTPVRGATQYCWFLRQIGDTVMVEWINCFDPRGWTPQFVLDWLKSAATNEFVNLRNVLYGEAVKAQKTALTVSEEEVAKAQKEADAAKK